MSVLAISCADNVQDLMHLLAKAVVYNTNDADKIKRIRINVTYEDCEDLVSAISCDNAGLSPESVIKPTIYVDCNNILTINVSMPNPT